MLSSGKLHIWRLCPKLAKSALFAELHIHFSSFKPDDLVYHSNLLHHLFLSSFSCFH
jgi:hypothetical protein